MQTILKFITITCLLATLGVLLYTQYRGFKRHMRGLAIDHVVRGLELFRHNGGGKQIPTYANLNEQQRELILVLLEYIIAFVDHEGKYTGSTPALILHSSIKNEVTANIRRSVDDIDLALALDYIKELFFRTWNPVNHNERRKPEISIKVTKLEDMPPNEITSRLTNNLGSRVAITVRIPLATKSSLTR